jgi:hypothetical protein
MNIGLKNLGRKNLGLDADFRRRGARCGIPRQQNGKWLIFGKDSRAA